MTSRASSTVKHTAPYAFTGAFSSGTAVTVLYAIYMILAIPVLNLICLIDERSLVLNPRSESFGEKLSDMYGYMLIASGNVFVPLTIAATAIMSIFMGIMMFRFITSKKTVNVYYSLGIKRTTLFLSRYFAGLIMLLACIVVPLVLSAIISVSYIGYNSALLKATLFAIVCFSSLAAFCYSLTAAVFSRVGTSVEGVAFTGILLVLPTIIIYSIENFATLLLYGFSYSQRTYTLPDGAFASSSGLVDDYYFFNPIIYINKLLVEYTGAMMDDGKMYKLASYSVGDKWTAPSFLIPLLWLAAAALVALAATFLYKRRKSEICGFIGMSGVLNFIGTFVIGFGCFAIAVVNLVEHNKVLAVALGVAAVVIAYFILTLILKRSPKAVFKKGYLALVQAALCVCIIGVFLLGGFGYSSKIPDENNVKSIRVSGVAADEATSRILELVNSWYNDDETLSENLSCVLRGDYTSEQDIKKAMALHSKLISLGSSNLDGDEYENVALQFIYKLKNGKEFLRFYRRADIEAIKMCLALEESDLIKQEIKEIYSTEKPSKYNAFAMNDKDTLSVIAVNRSFNRSACNVMEMTGEQYAQLLSALADDLSAQTWQQRFTPEKPAIGAIWFKPNDVDIPIEEYVEFEDGTVEDKQPEEEPETTSESLMREIGDNYSSRTVYITQDMARTLAFLESNGFMEYFHAADAAQVESISFSRAVIDRNGWAYRDGSTINLISTAKNLTLFSSRYYYDDNEKRDYGVNRIKDADKIAELLPLMHMRYFTFETGYFCFIKYTDGTVVREYIAENDAPDYVKYFDYKTLIDDRYSASGGVYVG